MFCLRCSGVELVQLPESNQEIKFFYCPVCHLGYAQRPGLALTYRWGHPISLVLYDFSYMSDPTDGLATGVARFIIEDAKDIEPFLQEIEAELRHTTQQVRDILDADESEEACREFLSKVVSLVRWTRSVLKTDPDDAWGYADRGMAYATSQKFELALNDFEQAFTLGYADASGYSTVANIYFQLKQLPQALEYFAKAIELNPDYVLAYYHRSRVLFESGDIKAAIADFEKCLEFSLNEDFKQRIVRRLDSLRTQQ